MSDLAQVFTDFNSDVERAKHLLEFVKSFREFGASTPPTAVSDGTAPWPQALALTDVSRARRTDLPILSGSLLLYLAGRFEYFVRELIRAGADEIATKFTTYAELPEKIRGELRTRTLEIAQSHRRFGYELTQVDAFLVQLVENTQGTRSPFSIQSEVLTITEANMRPELLADLMKRIGLNEYWMQVGKQSKMKLHLDKIKDDEATNEARSRLNSLMDERNQLAHPIAGMSFPDPDQVLERASLLAIIAEISVDIVRVHLSSFRTGSGP